MKIKSIYLLLFFFLYLSRSPGQSRSFHLTKGGCQTFGGKIYCYGFSSQAQKPVFCIYQLSPQLKLQDSLLLNVGKAGVEDYLQTSSDTLHGFLNIYLQRKETKLVTILRFSTKFIAVATIENVDVARLNSISAFESELLYSNRCVYTVKSQKDSLGRQFYLNKFSLKSELKNFEYEFAWQFAFERQYINSAHVFYANPHMVLLYVVVNGGPKAGQWVLRINATTGKLIRGTKLNDKGEGNTYEFGNFIQDTLTKTLWLSGQKFTDAQFKPQEARLTISNAPFASLYLVEIDSMADLVNKQEFRIPVTDAQSNSKKTICNYLFRVSRFAKNSDGKFSLETDIFRNSDNTFSYLYVNSVLLNLVPLEDKLVLEKNSIAANPLIEKFYIGRDKTDRNGKIAVDSLGEFERIYYKSLNFPVKQLFKLDDNNNPLWVLGKSDPKKNTFSYSFVSPIKKIYQLNPIEEISTGNNPALILLGPAAFIISRQVDETSYGLKYYTW